MRICIIALLLCWTSTAYAQKVVLFLKPAPGTTEVTDEVWWVHDQPLYSSTDESLHKSLSAKGVTVLKPTDLSRISKIVRQASLSDANARNLASLLGADIALIGTIRYEALKPLSVLPLHGVRFSIDARVVDLRDSTKERPLTTTRSAFARHDELARDAALDALSESLQLNLEKAHTRPEQPVGWVSDFAQLHIAGLTRGAFHDSIRERLKSHPLVHDVLTLWVAPGVVSLKLLDSGRQALSYKQLDEVVRSLMSETFEGFGLSMSANPLTPNTLELNVSTIAP